MNASKIDNTLEARRKEKENKRIFDGFLGELNSPEFKASVLAGLNGEAELSSVHDLGHYGAIDSRYFCFLLLEKETKRQFFIKAAYTSCFITDAYDAIGCARSTICRESKRLLAKQD